MRRLFAAVLVVVALTACSDPIESGYIVRKQYDDPDHWTTSEPVYTTVCTPQMRTRSVSNGNGGTTVQTYTDTVCTQQVLYYRPVSHYDGPHWRFRVRDDKKHDHLGWVEVDVREYDEKRIGDHWPDAR